MIIYKTYPEKASCFQQIYRLGISNSISVDIFIQPGLRYNEDVVATEKKGTVIEVHGPSHFLIIDRQSDRYKYNVRSLRKEELFEAMGYVYIPFI